MKIITMIQKNNIAFGIQRILMDMLKKYPDVEPHFPIDRFEQLLMEAKEVSKEDAQMVTQKVVGTGIIRRREEDNAFIL